MGNTETFKVDHEVIKDVVHWMINKGDNCPFLERPEFKSLHENKKILKEKYLSIDELIKHYDKYGYSKFTRYLNEVRKNIELKSPTHTLNIEYTIRLGYRTFEGAIKLRILCDFNFKLYIGNSLYSCLHEKFDGYEDHLITNVEDVKQKIKDYKLQSLRL